MLCIPKDTTRASIGPGGIEIIYKQLSRNELCALQLDRVELKSSLAGSELARSMGVSIGPDGIEIGDYELAHRLGAEL